MAAVQRRAPMRAVAGTIAGPVGTGTGPAARGRVLSRDGDGLEAGRCFLRAAAVLEQAGRVGDAARSLELAWEQLRRAGDAVSARDAVDRAVHLRLQQNKDFLAARFLVEVSAVTCQDGDYAAGAAGFLRAAELYGTYCPVHVASCKAQAAAAFVQTQPPNYAEAARLFSVLGAEALANSSSRHCHFLHAVMCMVANGDLEGARAALPIFAAQDPSFPLSVHGHQARRLITSLDDADVASVAYYPCTPSAQWLGLLLAAVKAVPRRTVSHADATSKSVG
jgi:hypothetical protein